MSEMPSPQNLTDEEIEQIPYQSIAFNYIPRDKEPDTLKRGTYNALEKEYVTSDKIFESVKKMLSNLSIADRWAILKATENPSTAQEVRNSVKAYREALAPVKEKLEQLGFDFE